MILQIGKMKGIEVSSFEEASKIVRKYTDEKNIGSRSFKGATLDDSSYFVAYNGRIFEGTEMNWKPSASVCVYG